jgi:hypothetical protein
MKVRALDFDLASGQHSGFTSHKIGFFCGVIAYRVHGFLRVVEPEMMGEAQAVFKARRDVRGVSQGNQQKVGPRDYILGCGTTYETSST